MADLPSVYLAGPEVFYPQFQEAFAAKIAICAELGFRPQLPSDNSQRTPGHAHVIMSLLSRLIYAANAQAMRASDIGVFDMTPFRGPSADVGTCIELGYMQGLGKPGFGYTNVSSDYLSRINPKSRRSSGTASRYGSTPTAAPSRPTAIRTT